MTNIVPGWKHLTKPTQPNRATRDWTSRIGSPPERIRTVGSGGGLGGHVLEADLVTGQPGGMGDAMAHGGGAAHRGGMGAAGLFEVV